MKNFITYKITITLFLLMLSLPIFATIAKPTPIQYKQPDGTYISIQIHGDEFLRWTTSGSRLVQQGNDGFYYYASFNSQGYVVRSNTRANSSYSPTQSIYNENESNIVPPMPAILRAQELRSKVFSSNTNNNDRYLTKGSTDRISLGNKEFITILVEFADLEMTHPKVDFENLLNQSGYSENGATGSVNDYYKDNSNNKFNPSYKVYGPYRVSHNYAYYGGGENDDNVQSLWKEVIELADKDVDFSNYDIDKDGYVDNVFFYYAGYNEAEGGPKNSIWPHKWLLYKHNVYADGVRIYNYACTSELKGSSGTTISGIGTFCHEFGHVIGLPDYYDTDYEDNGVAKGLGKYNLMSSGNYNNKGRTPPYLDTESKISLGWMDAPDELSESGNYSLEPVNNNKAYTSPTSNPGEYFLYENRQAQGWDAYVPSGLLIYHVDKSQNDIGNQTAKSKWESGREINSNASHQCYDLVEACGENNTKWDYTNVPFPGSDNVTEFTYLTNPGSLGWDNIPTGYNLTNITNSQNITFTLDRNELKYCDINGILKSPSNFRISYASIIITPVEQEKTSKSTKGKLSSIKYNKSSKVSVVVQTDKDGQFTFRAIDGESYLIEVESFGYEEYSNVLTIDSKNTNIEIYMVNTTSPGESLKKYKSLDINSIGEGEENIDYSVAVKFSSDELKSYVGKNIENIFVVLASTNVEQFDVFIKVDGKDIVRKNIRKEKIKEHNTIDISEFNFTIPNNKEILIGYDLKKARDAYPLAFDNGPYVTNGATIYDQETKDYIELMNMNLDLSYNLLVSATIGDGSTDKDILTKGFSFFKNIKKTYSDGDEFTIELIKASKAITSIKYYFDDNSVREEQIITLRSGKHLIKADLTYTDGKKETIKYYITVQ